jgi:hypothetical protein
MNLGKIQDRDRKTAGPRSGSKLERGSRLAQHCTRDEFDTFSSQVVSLSISVVRGTNRRSISLDDSL